MANAAKVQTALKLNEEDQGTIATLKKEIEKAWKLVDASHEKEAKAKETIQQLKLEISNLTRLVEQGSGLAVGEESTLNDLLKQKEELVRERDQQVDQIMALRADLMETQVRDLGAVCISLFGLCVIQHCSECAPHLVTAECASNSACGGLQQCRQRHMQGSSTVCVCTHAAHNRRSCVPLRTSSLAWSLTSHRSRRALVR